MTKRDPLSSETSVAVEVSQSGVKASARSRFIAAADRLTGNVLDLASLPLERWAERARARTEAERKLIEAAGDAAVKQVGTDPEFARRAIETHLSRIVRHQHNIEGVVAVALEDLRSDPPPEADEGPATVKDEFVERLEGYASGATSEALRERWGRVLASEARRPGTFSPKALRLVDELDTRTAQLFEQLCHSRLGNIVPLALGGSLSFSNTTLLADAGLIVPVGFTGQVMAGARTPDNSGTELWSWLLDKCGFAFPTSETPVELARNPLFKVQDDVPVVPCYVLTEAGAAVASIVQSDQLAALRKLRPLAVAQGINSLVFYQRKEGSTLYTNII